METEPLKLPKGASVSFQLYGQQIDSLVASNIFGGVTMVFSKVFGERSVGCGVTRTKEEFEGLPTCDKCEAEIKAERKEKRPYTMKQQGRIGVLCMVVLAVLTIGCRQQSNPASTRKPSLTSESFEQIHEGMTMDEVLNILGQPQAGDRAASDNTTTKLVGVSVTELAQWTEGSGDSKRQLEIGFIEGKVAAAIYRAGDVVGIKPEVLEGRFRVVAGRHSLGSPTTMRVVADFGSPESTLLHFGIGESTDEIEGFEPVTPPKRVEFTISGELLDQPQGDGKSLEVSLERLNPKATFTRKFAIDNEQDLSDVLAFAHQSAIYEPGEPIMLGRITGQEGVKYRIILHVVEKAAE